LKDSIANNLTGKEKALEPMAQALAAGLTEAARKTLSGSAAARCRRMEPASLRALLKPAALTGVRVRWEAGIGGSALMLITEPDLACLASLAPGRESASAATGTPELPERYLRFCSDAVEAAGRSFAQSHGLAIRAAAPELLNPDGRSEALDGLADSYADAVCLTFEISTAGHPPCCLLSLVDGELRSSLQAQLPGYAATASAGAPASGAAGSSPQGGEPGQTHQTKWNMELILDVELEVAVSFGETQMALRDILKLGVGSVVELDKAVNEPVAILVNHKPIARGEVVVVDGNYGVQVLEVASTAERIRSLG